MASVTFLRYSSDCQLAFLPSDILRFTSSERGIPFIGDGFPLLAGVLPFIRSLCLRSCSGVWIGAGLPFREALNLARVSSETGGLALHASRCLRRVSSEIGGRLN